MPVNVGSAFGAYDDNELVVIFVANSVIIFVVPTVKFGVVTVPVNVGFAKGAYDANAVVVAFVANSFIIFVVPTVKVPPTVALPVVDELAAEIAPLHVRFPVPPNVIILFVPPYHLKPVVLKLSAIENHMLPVSSPIP